MRLRWPAWGGRAARRSADSDEGKAVRRRRGRNVSRPRVARAAEAARVARATASVDAGDEMARVWRARESGPLWTNRHTSARAEAGLSSSLLWATAHAARASGREPEEIWAEALGAWLTEREQGGMAGARERRVPDGRRMQTWQAIDATLGQLRAS